MMERTRRVPNWRRPWRCNDCGKRFAKCESLEKHKCKYAKEAQCPHSQIQSKRFIIERALEFVKETTQLLKEIGG